MLEYLKRILDRLSNFDLASWLNSITISGYKVGLDTAQKDLEEEYPSEPDMEAIVRIGMRAHALSEKAIARAKGGMAHNADKLYQEMDAAMKAGMSEKEALFQIQGRVRGLFTDSYQEWELERLVRDQFLVATKEGRRAGWQKGGMKFRQWKIHRDNKTAADSKRMEGQIVEIDKPYIDSLTGEKYMLPHMRPNDRCFEVGLWELPEDTIERDGLIYAKNSESDFIKGGKGSGIRGHTTAEEKKYKNILSFENQVRNEKKENGLLCDKNGNVLLVLEGTENTVLFSASEKDFLFNKAAGGIFTHNHPLGNGFSKADILSSMNAKLQEVRAVGKEYTYSIKFKKEVPAYIRDEFPHRYEEIFDETYVIFRQKIFDGMPNRKAQQLCFHEMTQRLSEEFSEFFTYERTKSFSKGGVGSGIRGHKTHKEDKIHEIIRKFEDKIRGKPIEHAMFIDDNGKIILQKNGTRERIYFSSSESVKISLANGVILTHNHPNDSSISVNDIEASWKLGIMETRAVGKHNLSVLKFKKKIPEEIFNKIRVSMSMYHKKFYDDFTGKARRSEISAYDATIAYSYGWLAATVKDYPKWLEHERIRSIEKGGPGSGIRGHRTEKNEKKRKIYKMIRDFENKIREEPVESCLVVDGEGKVLISKQGTESEIRFTENERYKCIEGAKKGKVIFTHNHPSSSSFSLADIITANAFNYSEIRIAGKKHDYEMKISKTLNESELMNSYRAQNAHFYEKFNPLVKFNKLDKDKAWMTHTHLIWKHVAEEIDGLEYKRTR